MSLRDRLEALQAENAELYSRLSLLKKKTKYSNNSESLTNSLQMADEIMRTEKQLEREHEHKAKLKSQLLNLSTLLNQLQNTFDSEKLKVEHEMAKTLRGRENETRARLQKVVEKCSNIPQFTKIQELVREVQEKRDQIYKYQEEIERLTRIIASCPIEEDTDISRKQDELFLIPCDSDEIEVDSDLDENPLPHVARQPPSLQIARRRRRISFQIGSV